MKFPICCNSWIKKGSSIICALSNLNAICEIQNGKAKYIYSSNEPMDSTNLYSMSFEYNEKFFFIPYNAESILVYDRKKNNAHNIIYKIKSESGRKRISFLNAYVMKKNVYAFGASEPIMLQLNMETEEVIIKKLPIPIYMDRTFGNYISKGVFVYESDIFLPLRMEAALLKMNISREECKIISIDCDISGVASLSGDDEMIYMMAFRENQYKFVGMRIDGKEIYAIELFEANDDEKYRVFHEPVIFGEKAFIFPRSNLDRYYVVNIKKRYAYKYNSLKNYFPKNNTLFGFQFLKLDGNVIYFQTGNEKAWIHYDLRTKKVLSKEYFELDDQFFLKKWRSYELKNKIKNGEILKENEWMLKEFLKQIYYEKSVCG